MNEFQTHEVTIHQKVYGEWLVARILLVFFYVVFVIGMLVAGLLTKIFVPLLAFIPIALWFIIFITWRYTDVDYEYSMTSGFLSFSKIFGSRSRKQMFEAQIKSMTLIAPYTKEHMGKIREYAPKVRYTALSSQPSDKACFALFENAKGEKSIFIFEADDRTVSILRFYNPSATLNLRSHK